MATTRTPKATAAKSTAKATTAKATKAPARKAPAKTTAHLGATPRLSEAEVEKAVRGLIREGFTSKVGIMREMRSRGQGTRPQRLFPIAERLLAEAEKAAKAKAPRSRKSA